MGGMYYLSTMEEFFNNISFQENAGIIQSIPLEGSDDFIIVIYDKEGNFKQITHVIMEE